MFCIFRIITKYYLSIYLTGAHNESSTRSNLLNRRDELMFGLTQIVHELAMHQIPHEKWKRLLHLVTAHHDLPVAAHQQTIQIAVLAHLEQKHIVTR